MSLSYQEMLEKTRAHLEQHHTEVASKRSQPEAVEIAEVTKIDGKELFTRDGKRKVYVLEAVDCSGRRVIAEAAVPFKQENPTSGNFIWDQLLESAQNALGNPNLFRDRPVFYTKLFDTVDIKVSKRENLNGEFTLPASTILRELAAARKRS